MSVEYNEKEDKRAGNRKEELGNRKEERAEGKKIENRKEKKGILRTESLRKNAGR